MNEHYSPQRALDELCDVHGGAYDLWLAQGKFHARRVDATGTALSADTPEELDAAIRADQGDR